MNNFLLVGPQPDTSEAVTQVGVASFPRVCARELAACPA